MRCPVCKGDGFVPRPNRRCPNCGSSGVVHPREGERPAPQGEPNGRAAKAALYADMTAILLSLPADFLMGLPRHDQEAISSAIGRECVFVGMRDDGCAEIEFRFCGDIHTIWVPLEYIAVKDS